MPKSVKVGLALNLVACLATAAMLPAYWRPIPAALLALTLSVCCALQAIGFSLGNERGHISLGFAGLLSVGMIWGPAIAWIAGMVTGIFCMRIIRVSNHMQGVSTPPHSARHVVYHATHQAWTAAVAAWVYMTLLGHTGIAPVARAAGAALAATGVYFTSDIASIALLRFGLRRGALLGMWRTDLPGIGPQYLYSACCAVTFLHLARTAGAPCAIVLVVLPAVLIQRAYRAYFAKMRTNLQRISQLNDLNDSLITCMATAIEARDRTTERHLHRVRDLAQAIAGQMGLNERDTQALRCAAMVHDIGKIGVPDSILLRAGKLSDSEYDQVKRHVEIGVGILRPVKFPWPVLDTVMAHHENWDGTGYPRALRGREIPLTARILSVADVLDTLTTDRPYRAAMPQAQAIGAIIAAAGKQFDPEVVDALIAVLHRRTAAAPTATSIDPDTVARITEAHTEDTDLADRLHQSEALANTDALTGLPNARALQGTLTRRFGDAAATHLPFTVIVVDLDNFKMVNDTLGHLVGNDTLRRVATAIMDCIRPDDFLCRYAGDEFVLVLDQPSRDMLASLAPRLSAAVGEIGAELGIPLSASVGYATCPDDGLSQHEIIDIADRRMYAAKAERKHGGLRAA